MSGSLLEIKKKIKGVKNTRKITKAMKLVAASKMQRFQKRALASRGFSWELLGALDRMLIILANQKKTSPQLEAYHAVREEGKTLFVLYSSDKGLCGPLNTKLTQTLFRSEAWLALAPEERMLITIGKKAKDAAMHAGYEVYKSFEALPEKMNPIDALALVDTVLQLWNDGTAKSIHLVAPHYKNSFTFYPMVKQFLPLNNNVLVSALGALENQDKPKIENNPLDTMMIFEPDPVRAVLKVYETLLFAMMSQAFLELKAAEYSSRMMAMQNATDAASKMIDRLTLQFNKARQSAITQEIAELIGAKMALEE